MCSGICDMPLKGYTNDLILIQTFESRIEVTLVVRWTVFIGTKDFDGGEPLDLILSS